MTNDDIEKTADAIGEVIKKLKELQGADMETLLEETVHSSAGVIRIIESIENDINNMSSSGSIDEDITKNLLQQVASIRKAAGDYISDSINEHIKWLTSTLRGMIRGNMPKGAKPDIAMEGIDNTVSETVSETASETISELKQLENTINGALNGVTERIKAAKNNIGDKEQFAGAIEQFEDVGNDLKTVSSLLNEYSKLSSSALDESSIAGYEKIIDKLSEIKDRASTEDYQAALEAITDDSSSIIMGITPAISEISRNLKHSKALLNNKLAESVDRDIAAMQRVIDAANAEISGDLDNLSEEDIKGLQSKIHGVLRDAITGDKLKLREEEFGGYDEFADYPGVQELFNNQTEALGKLVELLDKVDETISKKFYSISDYAKEQIEKIKNELPNLGGLYFSGDYVVDLAGNKNLGTLSDYINNNADRFYTNTGSEIPKTAAHALKLLNEDVGGDTNITLTSAKETTNALAEIQHALRSLMSTKGGIDRAKLEDILKHYLADIDLSDADTDSSDADTNLSHADTDSSDADTNLSHVDTNLSDALFQNLNSILEAYPSVNIPNGSAAQPPKQPSSKTVNPLAKELSQLADNARQEANESIGKTSADLENIIAGLNKQFKDIQSKDGYQADSKETKSAQNAIKKLVDLAEKRRREELSEAKSRNKQQSFDDAVKDWQGITDEIGKIKTPDELISEAAGDDGEIVEEKFNELIKEQQQLIDGLEKRVKAYVGGKNIKSTDIRTAQSNLEKAKSALNKISTNATPQDISTGTNVPPQPELTEEEKALIEKQRKQQELLEKASDKFIDLKKTVRDRAKEEGELKHIGNSAEKNYGLAKKIVDDIDTARKEASDAAKAAGLDTAEIEQYGRTRYNDALGKLNAAATSITKKFIKEVYDGPLDKLEEALGDEGKLRDLGVSGDALKLLSEAEKGSKIENAVKSAIKEEQDAKKKAADQERKEVEDLRKIWKDALKADVVTAQSNVNNATTQEDKEAAQAQLVKASERYENFLGNVQAAGSDITNDEEIAKAKAATAKAAADLEKTLEGVSEYCKEYIKGIEDQVKAITSDKSLSADEKAFKIQQIQQGYGYKVRNGAEAQAVQDQYNDLTKLNSDLMRASQAEDELKQKALDVAAANRKIAEADTTDKQVAEHRNLAGIYRQQASATTDAAEREDLLTKATKEEAAAQKILDQELAKARQIAKDAQQAFMQIVDMVNSATNKVIGLIRSSIGLANKGVNATVNGGKKIVSTLGRVVQLFGSLSNRVRSCIATVINFARSTTQALGRVLNGVRSLIAHFNIFNRQAAGKNGLSLVFTELNSAISLAERAFNGLFNNQLLQRAIKFDSTIASITMLLGGEATDDAQEFAKSLQDGFNISYSQTISDLQEITSLLKAAGLEAAGLSKTGIVNAAEDLYSIAQYFGALGFQGGDVYEIMSKLQSGMKGMTVSIDDLGLSVRETDMNEFLKKNKQNVKFSELNEANKEAVRLGAILDQFTRNFDILDFSKLLEQPYYQISLIKSQITEIGTIIGKIFEGIISKYLPTILGALQLIRDTLNGIAEGMGIDLSGDDVQKSLEGIADAAGDVTDGMDDAAKATKDYTNTAGFDEITSLNSGSDEQKLDIDKLLANVGNISDLLQEAAKRNVKDYETLMDKWSKFVKDTLGKVADPFFGFNKGKAKKSLGNIGKNIQRWWKSFKETTLTLGLKFADDLQAGRFANDVLRLVDAITKLVAIIQEQLSPVVQDFYDKHLSKYVKEFGDKFHEFSKSFKRRVNQLDKDLKGGMTFGDAWKKNFGSILPPDLQTRLEKIVKIVKTLYEDYITPIKDAVLTTFDTMGTLSMGGLNIVDSTITKGEDGESLLDKVLGNYQTFSKDKLQPWIESTTNSIASYIETHKTEIANLIDQIANDLFDVFTLLADIVGKLITWNIENPGMLNTIAETAKKVLGFVSDNFDTIMRIVELFIQLISASIDGLLSGIQIIFDKIAELDTVKPGEDKSQLQNIIDNVCKFIKAIWEDLGTGISNLLQWVSDNEGKVDKALSAIEGIVALFSEHIVGVIEGILAIKAVTGLATLGKKLKAVAGGLEDIGSFFGLTKAGAAGAAGTAGSAGAAGAKGAAAAAGGGLAGAAASLAVATGIVAAAGIVAETYADAIWEKLSAESGFFSFAATEFSSGWNTIIGILYQVIGKLTNNAELMEKGNKLVEEANGKAESVEGAHLEKDLAQIAKTYFNSEDEGQKEWARYMLNEKFGITPEMLEPYMKSTEDISGNMIKLLDTTQTITTGDGKVLVNVPGLEDPILLAAAQQAQQTENQEALSKNVNSGLSDIQSSLGSSEKLTDRTNGLLSELTENVKGIWGDLLKGSDNDKESLPKNKKGLVEVAVAQMVDGSVPSSVIEQQKRDLTDLSKKQLKRKIKIRALGGSVPSGQLFIANEAGNPELIGQIGKKTGADVANRGMITDAMETAVYNGLVDALNQSRQQATTGTSTPTTINVNGFGLIDKNALRQFAKILAPYLSANKDSFITA